MESLVDHGKCRAIGLGDISLKELQPIYDAARIKPAAIQIESHPYLPETELLEFCKKRGIILLAFAPLGHGMHPGLLEDPVIVAIAARVKKDASAGSAGMGGAAWHGRAYYTQNCRACKRELRHFRSSRRCF